jgi:hypothetical protein
MIARHLAALSLLCSLAASAAAEDLRLADGLHWITVASAQDKDQAIGIARLYGDGARVVASQSGWFGVVLGPVKDKSLAAFVKSWQGWPEIPKDAVFSNGAKFTATAWQPPADVPGYAEFSFDQPATSRLGGYTVTATLTHSGDNQVVGLAGGKDGAGSFTLETPPDIYSELGNRLRLAPLDPASAAPEVMLTQYTGGAHCCMATWFASETEPGHWELFDTAMLDGDGYRLEDIDGDGSYELLSADNAFLYAFDSYAGSVAPIVISRLRGEEIEPVPQDAAWRARIAQDLAGLEFLAKLDPQMWKGNGFLAGWVATKILLGQGDAAWKKMLASYDQASDFGPQICTSGEKVDDCPADNLKPVPFPEALAAFLKENGYTPVPGG